MDPEFSKRYRDLYERHWWFRAREELIVEIIRSRRPPGGWGSILDVGCGDGLFFGRLQEFGDVEGVEPDGGVISPDNPFRQRIYVAPFDASFRPGKQYALILLLDVLEHLDAPVEALRQALSLLRPGGLLLITVPAFRLLWTNHDLLNHHRTRYTKAGFSRIAQEAGMKIDAACYLYAWLFPVKLAVRAKEALLGSKPEIPGVPPPALNRLLFRLCRLEEKLARALPLPVGSSLLVLGGAEAGATAAQESLKSGAAASREEVQIPRHGSQAQGLVDCAVRNQVFRPVST